MDEKRGSSRLKRHFKAPDDGFWDCTVCTYRNSQEAYKCEICDVRKGTSTRKPRLNAQVVAQQVAQQFPPPLKKERVTPPNSTIKRHRGDEVSYQKNNRTPGLKDIDRNSACHTPVTVGNVTVVITDYKPKLRRESLDTQNLSSDTNDSSSSSGSSTCNELNEDSNAESSN